MPEKLEGRIWGIKCTDSTVQRTKRDGCTGIKGGDGIPEKEYE